MQKTGLWETNTSVVLLRKAMECCTLDGKSPVTKSITSLRSNPNNTGHVEYIENERKGLLANMFVLISMHFYPILGIHMCQTWLPC